MAHGTPYSRRIYLPQTVFDAALDRVRRLYDEFPVVVVNTSGGKDSTVVLNLALRVAEEQGRLPVPVLWVDQEAEWDVVVRHVRSVMHDPRVKPYWFQGPFRLFNATSYTNEWLDCWKPVAEWLRPKEPDSIHENLTGCDRFKPLFAAIARTYWPDTPMAYLSGVRCEESPGRMRGLTSYSTYKDITWGNVKDRRRGHYTFYPLYDWSYTDVWKAIHDNGWPYCELYDWMYQRGVPVRNMRVSNVHHETALQTLRFLQELEPDMWNRVTARLADVNAYSQCHEAYTCPKTLPPMFASWREYRDYLLENLIEDAAKRERFRRLFLSHDGLYPPEMEAQLMKECITSLLVNDYEGTKLANFKSSRMMYLVNAGSRSRREEAAYRARHDAKGGA